MEHVRVRKDEYESPTVRNGWVSVAELRAHYYKLVSKKAALERDMLRGPGEHDEPYWFYKVRNREVLELHNEIQRLEQPGYGVLMERAEIDLSD